MKKYLIFLFLGLLLLTYGVKALTCTFEQNSCSSGICVISVYQPNNTHAAECSYYTWKICCSDPFFYSSNLRYQSCQPGESAILSLYQQNNSHVEKYDQGNYDYHVCVACPWVCTVRSGSCLADEECVLSLNQTTNSHVGQCGYYGLSLCCRKESESPRYSNVGQNTSEIYPGDAIKLYSFWQDNGLVRYAILATNETGEWENKTSYSSPLLIGSPSGWSNFTWQNSSISSGTTIGWRIYANDSCGNWNVTPINTFRIVTPISLEDTTGPIDLTGWGSTFTFRANVSHSEGYTVNVTLWKGYSSGGPWYYVDSQNCTDCSQETQLIFQGNYFTCDDYLSSGGTIWYKFNATDYLGGKNETQATSFNVRKDNTQASITQGANSNVNRYGTDYQLLEISISDTDSGSSLPSGRNCSIYVGSYRYNSQTDSNGYCSINFDPGCEFSPGMYIWLGGINSSDVCYNPSNSSESLITVYGQLFNNLELPPNQSTFNNGDIINISGNVISDCSAEGLIKNVTVTFEVKLSSSSQWKVLPRDSMLNLYFDEDEGRIAQDYSGYENHGTIFMQVGEAGIVEVNGKNVSVSLRSGYKDPVVFAVPRLLPNTFRSGTNRTQHHFIFNVTSNSFVIVQAESSSAGDGIINNTNVSYLVLETGTYYLGNLLVEVGKVSVGGTYVKVNLNNKFKDPIVLTDIQTFNNGVHSLFTRVRNIEPDSFEVQIESDDSSNPSISNEIVGYMVIEAGTDSNLKIEAKKATNINQNFATQTFSLSYSSPPVVIAQLVSENGGDQAYAVTRDVTSSDFELALEEPASRDGSHMNENFDWVAIPSGIIYGAIWTEGKFGNALSFDGINDWVKVSDSSTLDISNQISIEAWIKPNRIINVSNGKGIEVWNATGASSSTWNTTDEQGSGWTQITFLVSNVSGTYVFQNGLVRVVHNQNNAYIYRWDKDNSKWVQVWTTHYWWSDKNLTITQLDSEKVKGYWLNSNGNKYWISLERGSISPYVPTPWTHSGSLPSDLYMRFAVGDKLIDGAILGHGTAYSNGNRYYLGSTQTNYLLFFDPSKEWFMVTMPTGFSSTIGVKIDADSKKIYGISNSNPSHRYKTAWKYTYYSELYKEAEDISIEGISYISNSSVTNENVGTGDGSTSVFYLDWQNVVSNSEEIRVDGVLQQRDVNYTIDYSAGKITFITIPQSGSSITANYTYYDAYPNGAAINYTPNSTEVTVLKTSLNVPSGYYRIFLRVKSLSTNTAKFRVNNNSWVSNSQPDLMENLDLGEVYLIPNSQLSIKVKDETNTNSVILDYVVIIPVSNGYSMPEDIAYFKSKRSVLVKGNETQLISSYGLGLGYSGDFVGFLNENESISVEASEGWTHLILTYDESKLKFYRNGNLETERNLTEIISVNNFDILIGNYFNGTIDEIRIYNRSLTQQEIKLLYEKHKLSGYYNLTFDSYYQTGGWYDVRFNSSKKYYNSNSTIWTQRFYLNAYISIELSPKLSEGIFFTNFTGSLLNQQFPLDDMTVWNNATWNYNSSDSGKRTEYWVKNTGTNPEDICLRAKSNLICSSSGCTGSYIDITNAAWNNATSNDPAFDISKRLSLNYIKVAYSLAPGETIYLRFWVNPEPDTLPSGTYNTTFDVKGVSEGSTCG